MVTPPPGRGERSRRATIPPQRIVNENALRKIRNPPPGSALARARDYGIDLALIAAGVAATPQERLERAARAQIMARTISELRRKAERDK